MSKPTDAAVKTAPIQMIEAVAAELAGGVEMDTLCGCFADAYQHAHRNAGLDDRRAQAMYVEMFRSLPPGVIQAANKSWAATVALAIAEKRKQSDALAKQAGSGDHELLAVKRVHESDRGREKLPPDQARALVQRVVAGLQDIGPHLTPTDLDYLGTVAEGLTGHAFSTPPHKQATASFVAVPSRMAVVARVFTLASMLANVVAVGHFSIVSEELEARLAPNSKPHTEGEAE